jgi:hypothetical protein
MISRTSRALVSAAQIVLAWTSPASWMPSGVTGAVGLAAAARDAGVPWWVGLGHVVKPWLVGDAPAGAAAARARSERSKRVGDAFVTAAGRARLVVVSGHGARSSESVVTARGNSRAVSESWKTRFVRAALATREAVTVACLVRETKRAGRATVAALRDVELLLDRLGGKASTVLLERLTVRTNDAAGELGLADHECRRLFDASGNRDERDHR